MNLSFKDIFNRYGKRITKFLGDNIEKGGAEFISFNPKTTKGSVTKTVSVKGRVKSKLQKDNGTHQRMIVTGKTKQNAFKHKATDDSLTVFIDSKYEKIIEGNNLGGSFNRKNQVALFPTENTVSAFEQTPVIQELKSEVTKEIVDYFNNVLDVDIARTIKL